MNHVMVNCHVHSIYQRSDRRRLIGRDYAADALPEAARNFEAYKKGESREVPAVPFQMLMRWSLVQMGEVSHRFCRRLFCDLFLG